MHGFLILFARPTSLRRILVHADPSLLQVDSCSPLRPFVAALAGAAIDEPGDDSPDIQPEGATP